MISTCRESCFTGRLEKMQQVCVKNAAKKNENRYACVHNINMTVDFFTAAVGRVHIVVITIVARQRPNSSTTAVG